MNYGWRASLRLRKGLHWKTEKPTTEDYSGLIRAMIYLLAFAGLIFLIAFGIAAMQAQQDRELAEQELLDCLNGKVSLYYSNTSGYGHQRTYLVCKVEELQV